MTDQTVQVIAAFLAAIPPTLFALAAYRQSRRNYTKSEALAQKAEIVASKADVVSAKADVVSAKADIMAVTLEKKAEEIHKAVNGGLTKLKEELADSLRINAELRETLLAMKSEATK